MVATSDKIEKVTTELLNKMLSKHNIDVEYVKANEFIGKEKIPWYTYYTWTKEEEDKFKEEAIKTLVKEFRWSKRQAQRELAMFILMWGLKIQE